MSSRTSALLTAALCLIAPCASAQVQAGVELARDRSAWHFDNPSTYDTAELVPHYFEQRYTLDNLWLVASAAYRAGIDWRTSAGVTPVRELSATDYDTFFDPGGITWVAGTSGNARTHSFRISQAVEIGRRGAVSFTGGYRLRLDLADFLEGNRTDTRNGVLVSQTVVTTREYTNAQTHEVFVGAETSRPLGPRWRVRVSGEIAPTAVNRLAIELPDKYPGQTLVFRTTTGLAGGRIDLVRAARWPITVGVSAARSWKYHPDQWVSRSSIAVDVVLGKK
jgi:hypothetical protein